MNNEKRKELIIEARTWLNTPWKHNQCKKGLGVDCVNFIWKVCADCGIKGAELPFRYSRISKYNEIETYLKQYAKRVNTAKTGDLLLYKIKGFNTHIAFASDKGMIHASYPAKRVVEHSIDGIWLNYLESIWCIV